MNKELVTEYKKVDDLQAYVSKMFDGGAKAVIAEKTARIAARKGIPGEEITTWSQDADGNPLIEKTATISQADGIVEWVVSKIDEKGAFLIDQNGHNNQWIIDNSTFLRKYEADSGNPGIYKPVGGPQKFVRLSEAIHILQWGDEWNVDAGGYINITVQNDYYVISERDFNDTYRITSK